VDRWLRPDWFGKTGSLANGDDICGAAENNPPKLWDFLWRRLFDGCKTGERVVAGEETNSPQSSSSVCRFEVVRLGKAGAALWTKEVGWTF